MTNDEVMYTRSADEIDGYHYTGKGGGGVRSVVGSRAIRNQVGVDGARDETNPPVPARPWAPLPRKTMNAVIARCSGYAMKAPASVLRVPEHHMNQAN